MTDAVQEDGRGGGPVILLRNAGKSTWMQHFFIYVALTGYGFVVILYISLANVTCEHPMTEIILTLTALEILQAAWMLEAGAVRELEKKSD
jgi:hypothetical protein